MQSPDPDIQDAAVLIVDDVPRNLQLLGKILALQNYEVMVATDGQQALNTVEKKPPDAILLDVMMPGMDGFEVCERIKSNPKLKDIPILFLTAKTEIADKIKGFELGASDYIDKPFEVSEVLARVRTQVRLKRAQDTIKNHNQELEAILKQRTKALVRAERQAAISLLIEGIVHNFKNPLTGILGGSQLIQRYQNKVEDGIDPHLEEQNSPLQKFLEIVQKNAKIIENASIQLTNMVNSLMVRSREDRSDKIEPTDLNQLIHQELQFLDTNLRFKHDVQKEILLAPAKLTIDVIPLEIGQVFQNLIGNALDALVEHTHPAITIESGAQGESVWFSVSDNGPGIPEDIRPKIFEPFFTTKAKVDEDADGPKGTGLGLHACLEIVNVYNGRIEVDPSDTGGAKFTVFLPLGRHDTPSSEA
ncbi:MAG: hybrid sensor histidine kinase/response regulator [bacterium]|nr:hybrid sensor histidine kinase/response regulator [bacterium]